MQLVDLSSAAAADSAEAAQNWFVYSIETQTNIIYYYEVKPKEIRLNRFSILISILQVKKRRRNNNNKILFER